jgi:hypothetical protein
MQRASEESYPTNKSNIPYPNNGRISNQNRFGAFNVTDKTGLYTNKLVDGPSNSPN